MRVVFLGAHNLESSGTRCVSLLIDGVLALDAGSLTSGLTFPEQAALQAVFLSHSHYDHIRDIPALGLNLLRMGRSVDVYSSAEVRETVIETMLNGDLYPKVHERPPEAPAIRFNTVEAGDSFPIGGYQARALPMAHVKPSFGLEVIAPTGTTMFYTADTGPLPEDFWTQTAPDVLIIETTAPSAQTDLVQLAGHLTPALLEEELVRFRSLQGYLPRVLTVHMDPLLGDNGQMADELAEVARRTGAQIQVAAEGLEIEI